MPWNWDDDRPLPLPAAPEATAGDAYEIDRRRRHAARRHFLNAPPYRIEFDAENQAVLCEKRYEYWPALEPEYATSYRPLSRHADLEEAERRLRVIVGGPVYYDESGRVLRDKPKRRSRWDVPTDDD